MSARVRLHLLPPHRARELCCGADLDTLHNPTGSQIFYLEQLNWPEIKKKKKTRYFSQVFLFSRTENSPESLCWNLKTIVLPLLFIYSIYTFVTCCHFSFHRLQPVWLRERTLYWPKTWVWDCGCCLVWLWEPVMTLIKLGDWEPWGLWLRTRGRATHSYFLEPLFLLFIAETWMHHYLTKEAIWLKHGNSSWGVVSYMCWSKRLANFCHLRKCKI